MMPKPLRSARQSFLVSRVTIESALGRPYDTLKPFTSIETRDGDGVQVRYQSSGAKKWHYAIPGSEGAPAILRDNDTVVSQGRFPITGPPSAGPAMIPLAMPWVISLGDPLGVDQIGANEILKRSATVAVTQPRSADALPDSALGYSGADLIMVGISSKPLLESLSDSQCQAIQDWVHRGGHLFLTLGDSTDELIEAAPWLEELLPFSDVSTTKLNPSAFETYTSTQTPLQPFEGCKLPKGQGEVLVTGRTMRRVSAPLAAKYSVGFGLLTVVAADLESKQFRDWPERLDLIRQVTGSLLKTDGNPQKRTSRSTAYDDLAGQLRSTLDQFTIRRSFGFSMVSLALMLLIAAIGPLDYLLINRVFGRPLLGWISFPLAAIGLSAVLAIQAGLGKSAIDERTLECNRIEIIDVDTISQVGRGYAVSYLYSRDATLLDVDVKANPSFESITRTPQLKLTTPHGYSGESYGGIQIAIEDGRLPVYDVAFDDAEDQTSAKLMAMPLASRSSKGFATEYAFQPELNDTGTLRRRPGSDLLKGKLVNSLPFDLLDGLLVYRNWSYVLPTRFRAGASIASVDSLRQKNFRWRLARQKAIESSSETEEWDPARRDAPDRVAEMLMFHRAVGGSRYTNLKHEPLAFHTQIHISAFTNRTAYRLGINRDIIFYRNCHCSRYYIFTATFVG